MRCNMQSVTNQTFPSLDLITQPPTSENFSDIPDLPMYSVNTSALNCAQFNLMQVELILINSFYYSDI